MKTFYSLLLNAGMVFVAFASVSKSANAQTMPCKDVDLVHTVFAETIRDNLSSIQIFSENPDFSLGSAVARNVDTDSPAFFLTFYYDCSSSGCKRLWWEARRSTKNGKKVYEVLADDPESPFYKGGFSDFQLYSLKIKWAREILLADGLDPKKLCQ